MKNRIALAVFTTFALFVLPMTVKAQGDPGAGFEWRCTPTGKNSMQCQFKNTGSVQAGMCVEVVKVCKSGDHSAYVCTDKMSPGDVESRVVNNFDPKVKFLESCQGVEYRNKSFDK